jgi:hypothetical protein
MRYDSIEMIGLSGVGKTTMFYNLGDTLFQDLGKYSTVHPVTPPNFFFETLLLLVKTVISFEFLRSLFSLKLLNYFSLIMKLGYRASAIKMRDLNGLVYLRDSGVLMPLISSVIDDKLKIDNALLYKILSNLPLPKYVYCVSDSPVNIYSRFVAREKKLGNNIENYFLSDFENANNFVVKLVEILRNMGISVVVINKND